MGEDLANLPSSIPDDEVEEALSLARAVASGAPAAIDGALGERMVRAHLGTGYAENALKAHAALGRIDAAFALAEALFFGRGFIVPDIRFTGEQGTYSPLEDRQTHYLFGAETRGMRADPRFADLVEALGFTRYWHDSASLPDYRRG